MEQYAWLVDGFYTVTFSIVFLVTTLKAIELYIKEGS